MKGRIIGVTSATALAVLLAGCGGSGSGGGTPIVSTPGPSYTKIVDMSGNRTFQTAGVTYATAPSGLSNPTVNTFGSGTTVAYNAGTDSYTVTAASGGSQTFGPADIRPSDPGAPNAVQYVKVNGSTREQLTLIAPVASGAVPLSYLVIGSWGSVDTTNDTGTFRVAIGGSPTLASDMPKSGTASYTVGVGGSAMSSGTLYNLSGNSSGTFSASFGTGTVSTALTLAGTTTPGGAVESFGTFDGAGTIGSGGPGFSGTLTGGSGNGVFAGAFFGPQAAEMGFGYSLSGTTFSAAGAASGVKQ